MRYVIKRLTCMLAAGSLVMPVAGQAVGQQTPNLGAGEATVWYLGHAGWAVRLGTALLVFDYQESLQVEGIAADAPRGLHTGFINPEEIGDLDVYVFVTHAHGDHYDPVIFDWQGEIENLTYFIGWEERPTPHCEGFAETSAACHTLSGPRATVDLGDLQVYTIDSHHNDIPEVAYLVRLGEWWVYHNGDYMADHVADYAYLKTFTDRVDVAFVSGIPTHRWPHLARSVHLAREFEVPVLFPMHFRDREMCESFAAEVAAEGVSAEVRCPQARGQRFVMVKGGGG